VDFGIAKNIAAADRTNQGEVLGTPRYMSPSRAVAWCGRSSRSASTSPRATIR
jgi:hypothetical protein